MLLTAFITSIIVAKLLGGRLSRLGQIQYRHLDFLIMSVTIQIFLHAATMVGWHLSGKSILAAISASYALLCISLLYNLRLPGIPFALAGVIANAIVILANGGKMPISRPMLERAGLLRYLEMLSTGGSPTHQLIEKTTKLAFLSDIFAVPPPFWRPFVFSVGDVAIVIGLFILVIKTTVVRHGVARHG
ncbi:MAG TPA: DUF5317 domain-containing protein [Clostridia bacterium]|nr:DUF5317 domain-containing protein [Clostridia bacterium]